VDSTTGTGKVSRAGTDSSAYDWDRLERAVGALVARHKALRSEVRALGVELAERDGRIRRLEAQLLQANQRRSDTSKRIDELIAQLDQLDAQLDHAEPIS
jgi:chromosome segregation ATPase